MQYEMETLKVKLNTIDEAANFVRIMSHCDGKAVILLDSGWINAKSILGVLSLDLTKPLALKLSQKPDKNVLSQLRRWVIAA